MARTRSRVAPWSTSPRSPGEGVRILTETDTNALRQLVKQDPVANVFMASQLEAVGTAVPTAVGSDTLGYFDEGGTMTAACWVGANVVPVQATTEQAPAFGSWLASSRRRFASVFGPAEAVLGIFGDLKSAGATPVEIRANQPLLELRGDPTVAPNPALTPSRPEDFGQILPAAAAMFEEEVGYSPYLGGEEHYRSRVAALIRDGHSLSHLDSDGQVIFKADLGAVSRDVAQIQGVWLNPAYRGLGLSAGYMAAVVALAQRHAPVASLYVNDYNAPARASYERVGFRQVGTFATVLF